MSQDNSEEYRSGAALLAEWQCKTKEQKLERACLALMAALEELHVNYEEQSLEQNLDNHDVFCSCSDAYRMGKEALR